MVPRIKLKARCSREEAHTFYKPYVKCKGDVSSRHMEANACASHKKDIFDGLILRVLSHIFPIMNMQDIYKK